MQKGESMICNGGIELFLGAFGAHSLRAISTYSTERISLQGGRGHWTGNYTGTQSFVGSKTLGTFIEL